MLFDFRYAMIIWPLFCIGGFAFHLLKRGLKFFLTMKGLASCIPFVFSLISSLWFVAGALDLKLLSYNPAWSFYAALHGIFLGWIFVGCLAFLTMRTGASRIYLLGCYLSFALFLCVAFGIDGVPYLKPIGVVGFSLMMPLWIAHYAFHLEKSKKLSRTFAFISLSTIVLSMTLALLNEFWAEFPRVMFGLPTMVLTHGLLNSLVAVPCFFLAIVFEELASQKSSHESCLF